jgi:hypothetical protein
LFPCEIVNAILSNTIFELGSIVTVSLKDALKIPSVVEYEGTMTFNCFMFIY